MSAEPENELQASLAPAYRVERELGRGGMARVFLARDTKHDRFVALKVLHAELAASVGSDRFRREITLAARLQHPHILTVLDSGETSAGQLWFTMPYVAGESLRDRLRREGQLPLEDALRITREVALALDYAHRQGVIHRDVKPGNILLVDGQAMVADLGVARAITPGGTDETLTVAGAVIGTPAYMSPEQAAGRRDLDGTTDVYALGIVLYEMLTGERPLTNPGAQPDRARATTGGVPSIRRVRPSVPAAVDAVVRKALGPAPADRYATAAGFATALDGAASAVGLGGAARRGASGRRGHTARIGAALVALGACVGGVVVFAHRSFRPLLISHAPGGVRLAVLPFASGGDASDQGFADGMSEELTARLTRVAGVSVMGRTSALQYAASRQSAPAFGRLLGVDYVLDGTVRWAAGPDGSRRVRITPALIRVSDGTQVWAEPYEGVSADVFEFQADVSERVTQALRITLLPGERAAVRSAPTGDFQAYQLYLLGRLEWRKRTAAGLQRSADYFQHAIALDPKYARAYAGLADAYTLYWYYDVHTLPRDTAYGRAKVAAARALALDSTLAEAHATLGEIYDYADWNWEASGRELQHAIAADPSYATAHQWYAEHLTGLGRLDEARREAYTAVRLDPLAPAGMVVYANTLRFLGRNEEAIAAYRTAIALGAVVTPSTAEVVGTMPLFETYVTLGRTRDAVALLRSIGDTSTLRRDFARAPVDTAARRRLVRRLHEAPNWTQVKWFAILGERDSAFAALDRAIAEHMESVDNLKSSPMLTSLRGDPRYAAALRRVGLVP